MPITKNILIKLLDNRLNQNNIKLTKAFELLNYKGNLVKKLIFYILLPIFISIIAGLVIFYIQRQDLITSKKMESFEYLIAQFNTLSSNKYEKIESINFMYSAYLNILDNYKNKNYEYMKMNFDNLKLKTIAKEETRKIQTKVIINNIRIHSNLLKIYYGFSVDDTIFPIEKMIAIVEFNMKIEEEYNTRLYLIMDQVEEFYLQKPSQQQIEKFNDKFNQEVHQWIAGEEAMKTLNILSDLNKLYLNEFNTFQNIIYKTYEKEFDFFNFGNSKNEFYSIVANPTNSLQFNIVLDKNGKYTLKN
jgi:hypothetical protein